MTTQTTRLLLAALLCGSPAAAQRQASPAAAQPQAVKIDSLFRRLSRQGHYNGAVLVAERGRVLYHQAFGYADLPRQTPNTPNSRFQTASISKPFTATAVLQLLERGKLRLDDPYQRYFPAFPYPRITLRHLLTHTSGLPDLEMYEPLVRRNPALVVTNALAMPALQAWKRGLYFEPGAAWRYCNTNYQLLALLVERVSGLPFPAYLTRYVLRPAQMRDSYVKTADHAAPDPRLVTTHLRPTLYTAAPVPATAVQLKDTLRQWHLRFEQINAAGTVGDGNVVSTPADLLRFVQALYAGKLLRPRTLALATAPARLNDGRPVAAGASVDYGGATSYGLGWVLRQDPVLGKIVGHDGYTGGIATMLYHNEARNQTVVMYDNTVGEQFREKVASVVNVLNGQPPLPLRIKHSAARGYGAALLHEGPERALLRFNALRADTARYYLTERELNVLGYELLFNEYPTLAVEAFRLNALLYPASANVYDSYGDALRQLGKCAEAIQMYRRALALNPRSEGSRQSLQQLLASPQ